MPASKDDMEEVEDSCVCGHGIVCHTPAHTINQADFENGVARETCAHCICRAYHRKTSKPIKQSGDERVILDNSKPEPVPDAKLGVARATPLKKKRTKK